MYIVKFGAICIYPTFTSDMFFVMMAIKGDGLNEEKTADGIQSPAIIVMRNLIAVISCGSARITTISSCLIPRHMVV